MVCSSPSVHLPMPGGKLAPEDGANRLSLSDQTHSWPIVCCLQSLPPHVQQLSVRRKTRYHPVYESQSICRPLGVEQRSGKAQAGFKILSFFRGFLYHRVWQMRVAQVGDKPSQLILVLSCAPTPIPLGQAGMFASFSTGHERVYPLPLFSIRAARAHSPQKEGGKFKH